MNIRTATFEDCAAIARVQVNSYHAAYAALMPAEYLAAFSYEEQEQDWKDLLQSGQDTLLVAENLAGEVIGYALSRPTPQASYDCELVALHIDRDWQRQGIGRGLFHETARRMGALGCRSLGVWVLEGNLARGFYEYLGGQENGEQFFEIEELHLRRREVGYRWDNLKSAR